MLSNLLRKIPKKMDVKPQIIIDSPLMISVYILEMPVKGNIKYNLIQYMKMMLFLKKHKNRRNMIGKKKKRQEGSRNWDGSKITAFNFLHCDFFNYNAKGTRQQHSLKCPLPQTMLELHNEILRPLHLARINMNCQTPKELHLEIRTKYDLTILLLDIYPRELKTFVYIKIYT